MHGGTQASARSHWLGRRKSLVRCGLEVHTPASGGATDRAAQSGAFQPHPHRPMAHLPYADLSDADLQPLVQRIEAERGHKLRRES